MAIAVSSPFWGTRDPSQQDAQQLATSPDHVEKPSATDSQIAQHDPPEAVPPESVPPEAVEPVPVAPVPVAPVPVPPQSVTPPRSIDSPLAPWGPLPETGEDFKEEALEVARRVVEDYPRSAEALELMGTTLYLYGDTVEAETWWQKCLDEDPGCANACRKLGQAAFKRNEYEEAKRLMRKAAEIDPKLDGVYEDLADILMERGDLPQAVEVLRRGLDISPGRHEAHLMLAQALFQLREYDMAVKNYRRAAELNPLDSATQYGLANTYLRMRQRAQAAEAMQKFEDLRSKERRADQQGRMAARSLWDGSTLLGETLADAGRVYREQGDLRKAQHDWKRGMAVDAKNTFCREELFNLYVQRGRLTEAIEICRQLQELQPNNAPYQLNAGFLLTQAGQFDAAEEALKKVTELSPDHPRGYRFLAELFLLQPTRSEDAKAAAARLVELEANAENCCVLCRACEQAGDSAGALTAIERSIELDPINRQYKRMRDRLQENSQENR